MTAIRGIVPPTRRPGELGIHSLDHFHFDVPDLAVAKSFYAEFGLEIGEQRSEARPGTRGHPHRLGHDRRRPAQEASAICRSARSRTTSTVSPSGCRTMGVARLDPPPGSNSNGLWFHDHDGNLDRDRGGRRSRRRTRNRAFAFTAPRANRAARPCRCAVQRTYPRRLSHVLLFTRDVTKAIDFYTRVLGLRLSDHSGDNIAFLHGIHGSDHHMIAFAHSNAPGFHHLSAGTSAASTRSASGAMHMLGHGYDKGWGLGRHVLGSNFFHYVRDPWGSFAEYSADIDYVPVDCDWKAGDHPPEEFVLRLGPKSAGGLRPQLRGVRDRPDRARRADAGAGGPPPN